MTTREAEVITIARGVRACAGCESAETYARGLGDPERWVPCLACGTEWQCPPRPPSQPQAKRVRCPRPLPAPGDQRTRLFVHELLTWNSTVERVERAARGAASPLATIERVVELGVTGDGNRGTKRPGRPPERDKPDASVDVLLQAKYDALTGDALKCADAVVADGQGDQFVALTFGSETRPRVIECTLAERVGLRLAQPRQALTWFRKIASGDSLPARRESGTEGARLLGLATAAWFAGSDATPQQ